MIRSTGTDVITPVDGVHVVDRATFDPEATGVVEVPDVARAVPASAVAADSGALRVRSPRDRGTRRRPTEHRPRSRRSPRCPALRAGSPDRSPSGRIVTVAPSTGWPTHTPPPGSSAVASRIAVEVDVGDRQDLGHAVRRVQFGIRCELPDRRRASRRVPAHRPTSRDGARRSAPVGTSGPAVATTLASAAGEANASVASSSAHAADSAAAVSLPGVVTSQSGSTVDDAERRAVEGERCEGGEQPIGSR